MVAMVTMFSNIAADDESDYGISTVMINPPPNGLCLVHAVAWSMHHLN
jgi:hypothetical protein